MPMPVPPALPKYLISAARPSAPGRKATMLPPCSGLIRAMYTSPSPFTTMLRAVPRLSANTVAQKPLGKVMPPLPGSQVGAACNFGNHTSAAQNIINTTTSLRITILLGLRFEFTLYWTVNGTSVDTYTLGTRSPEPGTAVGMQLLAVDEEDELDELPLLTQARPAMAS